MATTTASGADKAATKKKDGPQVFSIADLGLYLSAELNGVFIDEQQRRRTRTLRSTLTHSN